MKAAPPGKKWCVGCEKFRAIRFFGNYSRCKPCRIRQQRASMLRRVYNLSIDEYDALKAYQDGRCAICGRATGASKALAVDHDHTCCPGAGSCGKCVRGLLCSVCNKMLGHARDDPEFFERAAAYLKRPPAKKMKLVQLRGVVS